MELYLQTDELDLIANILLEREAELSGPKQQSASSRQRGVDLKVCEELLDRVLVRDMDFDSDELEQLAGILAAEKQAMESALAQAESGPPNVALQRKVARLERVLEKVDEVCAML